MALVKGNNCGFVVAPSAVDPAAPNDQRIDNRSLAFKDISPAVYTAVTSIGWYCNTSSEETNYEVGIYTHNAVDDEPLNLIGSAKVNAKGTTAGWKNTNGLNIQITPNTTYWIAVQVDDTLTTTNTDKSNDDPGVELYSVMESETGLANPWVFEGEGENRLAIFAVVGTYIPEETPKRIGGGWLDKLSKEEVRKILKKRIKEKYEDDA